MSTRKEKLEQQVAKLVTRLNELVSQYQLAEQSLTATQNELAELNRVDTIAEGDVVLFTIGRGEDAKELSGNVLAVAETEKGKQLRVFAGEGFEAQVYTLSAKQVRLPAPVAAPETVEVPV